MTPNSSLERTRERKSAKFELRRARRSARSLGGARSRMLTGSCHCGAVHIEVTVPPQWLIECNCSICRRNGALWARYDVGAVRVTGHPEHTTEYIWGAKT